MSVSFYMNKDLEKSLAKTIQGLIAGAEKMQNFSIFRGFPQASFKKKKTLSHPCGLKCKVNSFTRRPLPPQGLYSLS